MTTSIPAGQARPFTKATPLLQVRGSYPPLEQIRALGDQSERRSREAFVRLWLTEGIPFAFRDCPAIYEDLRGWLAARIGVHPKEVTLLGSARLGYSLGGGSNLGQPFGPRSDFDFGIVSSRLFTRLCDLFEAWKHDYANGAVRPRHKRECHLWDANLHFGRQNLPQGFFDPNKIPTLDRYPLAQELGQSMWVLLEKLKQTPDAPIPKRASIRVYDGWNSLVERVSFNLYRVFSDRAA